MNRALSGLDINRVSDPASAILFYESTSVTPNAADDLRSLPPKDGESGFVVGWADGHCYYKSPADRPYLIQQSRDAVKGKG